MKLTAIMASFVVALTPLAAMSQEPDACRMSETVASCWTRMRNSFADKMMSDGAQGQPTAALDPALGKSIKDFLPPLAVGFSAPSKGKNVAAIQFNTRRINLLGPGRLQLGGLLRSPEPYKVLIEAVPQAQRAAAAKTVTDDFRDIDDPEITIVWNVETRSLGRSLSSHRQALERLLNTDALQQSPTLALSDAYDKLEENNKGGRGCTASDRMENWPMSCAKDAVVEPIRAIVRESARIAAAQQTTIRQEASSSGLWTVPFLINNQPQIHFDFGYRHSDRMIGPKQAYGEVSYEASRYNMNGLSGFCRTRTTVIDAACLRAYVTDKQVRDGLRNGGRFAFTLGATRYLDYDAALSSYSVALSEPASWQFRAKSSWGRFIRVDEEGTGKAGGRVETSFEFVNHTNDDFRNRNRVLGTISYTHRVNDDVTLTTGLVAANKAEVRGDVDWPIGARAGFTYKLSEKSSK